MLNSLLKTRQKKGYAVHTALITARKARTLTTTSTSGSKRAALGQRGTSWWKRRSSLHSTVYFQLVEKALNDLRQITFWGISTLYPKSVNRDF